MYHELRKRGTVIAALAWRQRQMALQFHLIVQDTADFNDPTFDDSVEEEVTSAPTVPCNMDRVEAPHDLVTRF